MDANSSAVGLYDALDGSKPEADPGLVCICRTEIRLKYASLGTQGNSRPGVLHEEMYRSGDDGGTSNDPFRWRIPDVFDGIPNQILKHDDDCCFAAGHLHVGNRFDRQAHPGALRDWNKILPQSFYDVPQIDAFPWIWLGSCQCEAQQLIDNHLNSAEGAPGSSEQLPRPRNGGKCALEHPEPNRDSLHRTEYLVRHSGRELLKLNHSGLEVRIFQRLGAVWRVAFVQRIRTQGWD